MVLHPQLLQAGSAQRPDHCSTQASLPHPSIRVFPGQPGMLEGRGEIRLETQEVGLDMGFPPAPA